MSPTVVLDLDHTLVHCCCESVEGFDRFEVDLGAGETHTIHVRPHALEFLRILADSHLDVVVLTAGTSAYAHQVVEGLYRQMGVDEWRTHVCLLLTRDHTYYVAPDTYVKDLDVVRDALGTTHVLLLDDNPVHETLPQNQGRILRVPPFRATTEGADEDRVLAVFGRALRKGLEDRLSTLADEDSAGDTLSSRECVNVVGGAATGR